MTNLESLTDTNPHSCDRQTFPGDGCFFAIAAFAEASLQERNELLGIARQPVRVCQFLAVAVGDDVVRQRNRLECIPFKLLIAFRCGIRAIRVQLEKDIVLQGCGYFGLREDVGFQPVAIWQV